MCSFRRSSRNGSRSAPTPYSWRSTSPAFSVAHFVKGGWSGADNFSAATLPGIVAAIPFAIWFFLAIEGRAMAAEEAKNPKRSVPIACIGGILRLVALPLGVMVFAGGSGDWTKLANINDPLQQAMKIVVGSSSGWLHMLVWLGLFGLVASLFARCALWNASSDEVGVLQNGGETHEQRVVASTALPPAQSYAAPARRLPKRSGRRGDDREGATAPEPAS